MLRPFLPLIMGLTYDFKYWCILNCEYYPVFIKSLTWDKLVKYLDGLWRRSNFRCQSGGFSVIERPICPNAFHGNTVYTHTQKKVLSFMGIQICGVRHLSHITCHMLHVPCHMSCLTFFLSFLEISSKYCHSQILRVRKLKFWESIRPSPSSTCHMSQFMCHVSPVKCHM